MKPFLIENVQHKKKIRINNRKIRLSNKNGMVDGVAANYNKNNLHRWLVLLSKIWNIR